MSTNNISRVCVFCGSSPGTDPAYLAAARGLGECLASRGLGLVYGGSNVGIMGAVAEGALKQKGDVFGVVPSAFADEVGHPQLTEQYVVPTMHDRKKKMFDLSDAFVVLPGGFGTLEEMFEILTWGQIGLHTKPIGIMNIAGYFDALLSFMDSAVLNRFVAQPHRDNLLVDRSPASLLDRLGEHRPIVTEKWLDRSKSD